MKRWLLITLLIVMGYQGWQFAADSACATAQSKDGRITLAGVECETSLGWWGLSVLQARQEKAEEVKQCGIKCDPRYIPPLDWVSY